MAYINATRKKVCFIFLFALHISGNAYSYIEAVDWTVIGAGPVGIRAVAEIVKNGVAGDKIVWIDPEFNVGRMGKYYRNVPGNSTVHQIITFLKECSFCDEIRSASFNCLCNMPLDKTPELRFIVDPLLDLTRYLRTQVQTLQDEMTALDFCNNQWHIQTKEIAFCSKNVVLATGAHPKTLRYEGVSVIPLDLALDKNTLAAYVAPTDKVAVIGSSHSALLIVKYLTELSVDSIINFYTKPIRYPTLFRTNIAWQETGLKGDLAVWTKTVLEVNPPANVVRIENTPEQLQTLLPHCTKVIYAIGYERNELPAINGDGSIYDKYDVTTGVIAPRLYGLGIAFPQQNIDSLGNVEYLVGLPYLKFDTLQRALQGK